MWQHTTPSIEKTYRNKLDLSFRPLCAKSRKSYLLHPSSNQTQGLSMYEEEMDTLLKNQWHENPFDQF